MIRWGADARLGSMTLSVVGHTEHTVTHTLKSVAAELNEKKQKLCLYEVEIVSSHMIFHDDSKDP